jgi:hypothetical protein
MSPANLPLFSTFALGSIATIHLTTAVSPHSYNIHANLISHFSGYFERALKLPNHPLSVITLEAVKPSVFNVFVQWLYTGTLPSSSAKWSEFAELTTETLEKEIMRSMLEAVVFGHQYSAPVFQATVHNALVDKLVSMRPNCAPSCADIVYAFNNLPADDALLELFVELHCFYGYEGLDTPEEMSVKDQMPKEFWERVTKKGVRFVDLEGRDVLKACDWHVYGSEEERWECGGT